MKLEIASLEDCVRQIKEEKSYELYADRLHKIGVNAHNNPDIEFNPFKELSQYAHSLSSYKSCEVCSEYFDTSGFSKFNFCLVCEKQMCKECVKVDKKNVCICKDCINPSITLEDFKKEIANE